MSDLTVFKEMIGRVEGLKCTESKSRASYDAAQPRAPRPDHTILSIEGNGSIGYLGFAAVLRFDENGKLVDVGGEE